MQRNIAFYGAQKSPRKRKQNNLRKTADQLSLPVSAQSHIWEKNNRKTFLSKRWIPMEYIRNKFLKVTDCDVITTITVGARVSRSISERYLTSGG